MTVLQQQLQEAFPGFTFQFDLSLASKTYFKIGGPAEAYIELSEREQIASLVKWCYEHSVKVTLLGGASNVIVSDSGIRGVVIHVTYDEMTLLSSPQSQDSSHQHVMVGAGAKMALFVKKTVDEGLSGLEYFLGVPGTVGGATYNNAHYLEDLIGEHIVRVEVITAEGEFQWLAQEECDFGYDSSRFQKTREVIFQVEFALKPGEKEESLNHIKKATQYRARTQPLGLPSSGCIFQNVPNNPALQARFPQFAERSHVPGGFLIDQAGLKNTRVGDIEVSEKHAAFFVNRGQGKAEDVKKLIEIVKSTVQEKFQVELQEEVFWLE